LDGPAQYLDQQLLEDGTIGEEQVIADDGRCRDGDASLCRQRRDQAQGLSDNLAQVQRCRLGGEDGEFAAQAIHSAPRQLRRRRRSFRPGAEHLSQLLLGLGEIAEYLAPAQGELIHHDGDGQALDVASGEHIAGAGLTRAERSTARGAQRLDRFQ